MRKLRKSLPWLTFGIGLAIGVSAGVGMLIGAKSVSHDEAAGSESPEEIMSRLHAAAAHGGNSLAMATGRIDEDVEGVFILDFLTGDLHCWVINPRALGQGFIGQYKQNILADLGLEKGKSPDYVLTTGGVTAVRGAGAERPAQCVVYVGDGNSGNVVAYGLPWNPTLKAAGRAQGGPMVRLAVGKARPTLEAD